ncbi:phosphoribosylpyrophosphate synthetase [Thalassospira sp. MA62]|nr:phosphoribosylpyrophosphate synthetase [Thalassospira sp. MA62]
MNLSELQENAIENGFDHHFMCEENGVRSDGTGQLYDANDLRLVHTASTDQGTDPGDDATLYMIEAKDGTKGFMIMPDAFNTDPKKAEIIDVMRSNGRQ